MTNLKLFLSLIIPLSLGWSCLRWMTKNIKMPPIFEWGIAYGLGFGLLTQWMFLLTLLKIPFSFWSIGGPLLGITFLFLFLISKASPKAEDTGEINISGLFVKREDIEAVQEGRSRLPLLFIKAFIVINLCISFWIAVHTPIASWDAVATIALKAKYFFFEQSVPPLRELPHRTYPLFVPFSQAWICFNLGEWNDVLPKIIFPLSFTSLLIISYFFLRYFTNDFYASAGVAMIISSNLLFSHTTISYRDFSLVYFNCVTILFLVLWAGTRLNAFLYLASLFGGFTTFVKLEGTAFVAIYLLIIMIISWGIQKSSFKKKFMNFIIFILPILIMGLSFHVYKYYQAVGLETDAKAKLDLSLQNFMRLKIVLLVILEDLFFSGNWHLTWLVLGGSLLFYFKRIKRAEVFLIFLSLLSYFGLYIAVALFTTNYYWIAGGGSGTGLSRLLLHFYPLSVICIVLIAYPGLYASDKKEKLRFLQFYRHEHPQQTA